VDGCFWHGCPDHYVAPKLNEAFWRAKIDANRKRDSDTIARLSADGWQVLRYWEHQSVGDMFASITLAVNQSKVTSAGQGSKQVQRNVLLEDRIERETPSGNL